MPAYNFISMQGPPHAPQFRYSVTHNGETIGEGVGSSKQNAQQEDARDALRRLGRAD
jgi:ribonuclease-3